MMMMMGHGIMMGMRRPLGMPIHMWSSYGHPVEAVMLMMMYFRHQRIDTSTDGRK